MLVHPLAPGATCSVWALPAGAVPRRPGSSTLGLSTLLQEHRTHLPDTVNRVQGSPVLADCPPE